MLIGSEGRIVSHARARNLADGTTRFLIDPVDHIRAMRDSRHQGLDVVGFYHSHPNSPAYPSATDIEECGYFGVLHLIAGIEAAQPQLRLFRLDETCVTELTYRVVERQGFPLLTSNF